jgi:hypothetical protein
MNENKKKGVSNYARDVISHDSIMSLKFSSLNDDYDRLGVKDPL